MSLTSVWHTVGPRAQVFGALPPLAPVGPAVLSGGSSSVLATALKEAFTKLELELDGGQEGSQDEGSREGQEDGATCEACQKVESSCDKA